MVCLLSLYICGSLTKKMKTEKKFILVYLNLMFLCKFILEAIPWTNQY